VIAASELCLAKVSMQLDWMRWTAVLSAYDLGGTKQSASCHLFSLEANTVYRSSFAHMPKSREQSGGLGDLWLVHAVPATAKVVSGVKASKHSVWTILSFADGASLWRTRSYTKQLV
jgi:hypothetical protein